MHTHNRLLDKAVPDKAGKAVSGISDFVNVIYDTCNSTGCSYSSIRRCLLPTRADRMKHSAHCLRMFTQERPFNKWFCAKGKKKSFL